MAGRAAVVIGINYETQAGGGGTRAGLTRLRFAEADAQAVAEELGQADYAVKLLLGAAATERAIRSAIAAQRKAAGADGLLLVHFSGHGDVDPDDEQTAYLLPVDTDPDDLGATAIPLRTLVHDYLGRVGTALTLLDCCHSGWALGWRSAGDRGEPFLRQARTTFAEAAQGRVVVTACPGDDVAREAADLGHGVFTHFLLEHWRTHSEAVTVESLFLRVVAGLQERSLPLPVRGGTSEGAIELRPARGAAPAALPPLVGLSLAEGERRERLYATISGLSEQGWTALLEGVGEEAGAYSGARVGAARRLILKLAGEGLLGALAAAAEQAARAAEVADLIEQFEAVRRRGDWDAAVMLGEQILGLDAQHRPTHRLAAVAYWERGKHYHNMRPPSWPKTLHGAHHARALKERNERFIKERHEHAIADYSRAIELDPLHAQYYWDRGVSYHDKGEYDQAIADYSQAIELDPQNGEYYCSRGVSYQAKGEYDRAIADHTRAIERDPQNGEYYHSRGVSHQAKGEYDRAIADHTRAIERDPQNGEYYYSRGITYQRKEDLKAAQADFESALALGYEDARDNLDRILAKGEYDRAIADYSQAIERDPQNGEYYYSRGIAYQRKEDLKAAQADFESALALGYEDARDELEDILDIRRLNDDEDEHEL